MITEEIMEAVGLMTDLCSDNQQLYLSNEEA